MDQMFETKIDFFASVKMVSIALNGLLKESGPVTQVKNHYSIPEKNKNIAKDAETAYLFQNVFGRLRGAEITLEEAGDGKTVLTLKGAYRKFKALFILMMFVAVMFVGIGFVCVLQTEYAMSAVFVGIGLLYAFIGFLSYRANNAKRLNRMVDTYFIPRINSYIEIVRKNM